MWIEKRFLEFYAALLGRMFRPTVRWSSAALREDSVMIFSLSSDGELAQIGRAHV